jgi:hypothetical protein
VLSTSEHLSRLVVEKLVHLLTVDVPPLPHLQLLI